jgi:hypothetical protein
MNAMTTPQQHTPEDEQAADVSSRFTQSRKTRRPNGLNFKMRELFNKGRLTTWEYNQYKVMVSVFAKAEGLYYDEMDEQLWEMDAS